MNISSRVPGTTRNSGWRGVDAEIASGRVPNTNLKWTTTQRRVRKANAHQLDVATITRVDSQRLEGSL
jgi:hypothetical protein